MIQVCGCVTRFSAQSVSVARGEDTCRTIVSLLAAVLVGARDHLSELCRRLGLDSGQHMSLAGVVAPACPMTSAGCIGQHGRLVLMGRKST
jgi:hypothetical protein